MITRFEICRQALDDLLGHRFGTKAEKVAALREIERTAKRMADGIEQRERDRADAAAGI